MKKIQGYMIEGIYLNQNYIFFENCFTLPTSAKTFDCLFCSGHEYGPWASCFVLFAERRKQSVASSCDVRGIK